MLSIANVNGEEYGRYPVRGDFLVFGAQGIAIDDAVDWMIREARLSWDGDHLEVPSSTDAASETARIENLPFESSLLLAVDELELSVRSALCLKNEGITYVGDLVTRTEDELLSTPNFGRKSLNEIGQVLSHLGLRFGMSVPAWPPDNVEELAQAYSNQRERDESASIAS